MTVPPQPPPEGEHPPHYPYGPYSYGPAGYPPPPGYPQYPPGYYPYRQAPPRPGGDAVVGMTFVGIFCLLGDDLRYLSGPGERDEWGILA